LSTSISEFQKSKERSSFSFIIINNSGEKVDEKSESDEPKEGAEGEAPTGEADEGGGEEVKEETPAAAEEVPMEQESTNEPAKSGDDEPKEDEDLDSLLSGDMKINPLLVHVSLSVPILRKAFVRRKIRLVISQFDNRTTIIELEFSSIQQMSSKLALFLQSYKDSENFIDHSKALFTRGILTHNIAIKRYFCAMDLYRPR